MTELICVDPARISEFWPHVKHLIRSAVERTELSDFESVETSVLKGDHLLWIAWNGQSIEAACTTSLNRVGRKKFCTLIACGGEERDRWLPLLDKIERYASEEGCDAMRIFGRKGWERVLDRYCADYVILQKVLN